MVYEVANVLALRHVPFVFVTGYGQIDQRFDTAPRVAKPFDEHELVRAILDALAGASLKQQGDAPDRKV